MGELKLEQVGKVTHYFTKAGVAIVEVSGPLSAGDRVLIKGSTTNIEQTVNSMQIEHAAVKRVKQGQTIGLKVDDRVREGDIVYKVVL